MLIYAAITFCFFCVNYCSKRYKEIRKSLRVIFITRAVVLIVNSACTASFANSSSSQFKTLYRGKRPKTNAR